MRPHSGSALGSTKAGGRLEAGAGGAGSANGNSPWSDGRGVVSLSVRQLEAPDRERKRRKGPRQIVRYSDEVISSWQVFTLLSGTVFTSRRLWSAVALYWVLALVICLLILHFESEASHLQYTSFKALVDYLSTLIGFLLGMYVSNSLSRWWSLRMHIDHLWGCVDDLCMLACSHVLEEDEQVDASTGVLRAPALATSPRSRQSDTESGQGEQWGSGAPETRSRCKLEDGSSDPARPQSERDAGELDSPDAGPATANTKAVTSDEGRDDTPRTAHASRPPSGRTWTGRLVESEPQIRLGGDSPRQAADHSQIRPAALVLDEQEERLLLTKANVLRLILRLGKVAMNLTFDAAERESGDLSYLQNAGLLNAEELRLLEPAPSKAQVVWVWLSQLGTLLAKRGRLLFAANATRKWHEICARGRGEVAACWAFVETQLPFSYVHLLSVLVHINNLFLSILTGVGAAACVSQLAETYEARATWFAPPGPLLGSSSVLATSVATAPPGAGGPGASAGRGPSSVRGGEGGTRLRPMQRTAVWEVTQMLLMHVMLLLVIPIFYHGMINLAQTIGHPFGYKSVAFPKDLYVHLMDAECSSFFTVGQAGPPLFQAAPFPASAARSPSCADLSPTPSSAWSSSSFLGRDKAGAACGVKAKAARDKLGR
ncbi:hypothetical protein BESB_071740 [Besnoitia besnoiti]|uniref:Bestrophin n=1 Tax=Besnoitia besnoiti TaxID=94643 RepID=A0A2A9MF59_BESBE|nr:uncharacterized protein BESB_071740 [Besnoitia besnoiti]PFH34022.1 hypothetical protein BESB_071740 [Besnoitia besnoiti]